MQKYSLLHSGRAPTCFHRGYFHLSILATSECWLEIVRKVLEERLIALGTLYIVIVLLYRQAVVRLERLRRRLLG